MMEDGRGKMEEVKCKMDNVLFRLREFIEDEARSGSMDFGCITPLYVYRMWGGIVAIDEIATALADLRNQGFMVG